jgi:hypothetical protein
MSMAAGLAGPVGLSQSGIAAGTALNAGFWSNILNWSLLAQNIVGQFGQITANIKGGNYSEDISNKNAKLLEQEALLAEQEAASEEERIRKEGSQVVGRQRALYGASGVAISGSPVSVLLDTEDQIEADAELIRYGGQVKASKLRYQAGLTRAEGRMAKSNAYSSGYAGLSNTLLTAPAMYARLKGF